MMLLSSRTAKYVDAMIHEGDKFDYRGWLRRVREEEAQAKHFPVAFSSGEYVVPEIGDLTNTPNSRYAPMHSEPVLPIKTSPIPRPTYRSDHKATGESPKDRLRRRLVSVSNAFDEFQESRVRNAVYGYLKFVFALVVDYKGRRRTKRLLRRAFRFAGLRFDENADPFAAVIRCTSEQKLDCKTISKYSRALRYTARCKKPRTSLKTFMKEMGGVGGCADRFARYLGRGRP
jgi:hypothetical protein